LTITLLLGGVMLLLLLIRQPLRAAHATAPAATYRIIQDSKKQTTIAVSGAGATVTLADIQRAVAVTDTTYLSSSTNGLWRLNVNLLIGPDVTLNLAPAQGVNELQLRSGNNRGLSLAERMAERAADANSPDALAAIAYSTFVYLKTEHGTINIDGVKIYSWDEARQQVDEDESNGRAYILAKYAATLNIRNSDIGYLGSKDGESYGIAWRDVGEIGDAFITRVTGAVINSQIHHNYYGIYTYQAQNMIFRGNAFYSNLRYGFDPHDYSHHFLVEDNVAYNNGAHGFIISRGCNNFVFRNNKAYANFDPGSNLAHGFMLDPGGADIDKPQVSSSANLLENNEAYNNEGYGIRILGSSDNTLRDNYFHHNEMGISVDTDSDRNLFQGNRVEENRRYGFYMQENEANQLVGNAINRNGSEGIESRKTVGMRIAENTIQANGSHGVDISNGAQNNRLLRNTIRANNGYGLVVSGSTATGNHWSQNSIAANLAGGINDQVRQVAPPQLVSATTAQAAGRAKAGSTVELFAGDTADGQGARYVGSTVVDGSGDFVYRVSGPWGGSYLTAITLEPAGPASAFSAPIAVLGGDPPTATAVATGTPTVTPPVTATLTPTPSNTPTSSPEATTTFTPTATASTSPTLTVTATPSATRMPTIESTPTLESTPVGTGLTEQRYLPLVIQR
jgi:parallel beta-helix repeat protein